MKTLGATQYAEAAADPLAISLYENVVMRPFHETYPGDEQLFHVYCAEHLDFGYCGVRNDAGDVASAHWMRTHGHERGSYDPEEGVK